ncbi:MAG TPA: OmpA family protein [Terriglobia bacterium]|nr:OmpA family protein [Terriglobia bacterium]
MSIFIGPISAVLLLLGAPVGQDPGRAGVQISTAETIYAIDTATPINVNAVDYKTRGQATSLSMIGTPTMPNAGGSAIVQSRKGYMSVDARFDNLEPACTHGSQFQTYVLWAVTPDGRTENLGELILDDPNDHDAMLNVTTDLQYFGLIVTAEPHFSVVRPSGVVVIENAPIQSAACGCETSTFAMPAPTGFITGQFSIVPGVPGGISASYPNDSFTGNSTSIAQAHNAIDMAMAQGAETYAPQPLQRARDLLAEAESRCSEGCAADADALARQAAQFAEDARLMSMVTLGKARLASLMATTAEVTVDTAEIDRLKAELAEKERMEAELRAALANQPGIIKIETGEIDIDLLKAMADKDKTLADLRKRLGELMTLRETTRGLIGDLDVRFAFDSSALTESDREKLEKVATILGAMPEVTLKVEGHTDSVGTEAYNQKLSERRADSVRTYLVDHGVSSSRITAMGFGESQPVAPNNTAVGRSKNRRVDLVVSGEAIGYPESDSEPNQ